MAPLVLVTGGTGTLGRQVAARLRDAGGKVWVLSRRSQAPGDGIEYVAGDLLTGEGIGPAVDGAGVIVHCASSNKGDADATRNLVRAAASLPEPPDVVYISIVGSELVSFGYPREKLEAERIVSGSGLPWTTLRVTQFYDLIFKGARALARLPVVPAGCPTWAARRCSASPACCARTCGRATGAARSCRYGCRASARSAPAPCWFPSRPPRPP